MPDLPFSSTQLLAGVASLLLVFVSGGVIYLSIVDWRDRRRRAAAGQAAGSAASGSRQGLSPGSKTKASSSKRRSPRL